MRLIRSFGPIFFILAALVAASSAFADEAKPDQLIEPAGDLVLHTRMSGFDIIFPAPSWVGPDQSAMEQSRPSVATPRPGLTTLILSQTDEDSILWTELMGLIAVNLPGYNAGAQFRNIAEPMAQRCMPDQYDFFWVPPLEGTEREVLVGVCGAYRLESQKTSACVGGIVVAIAMERPEGSVSVYNEWCTASFTAVDREKWPVSEADLTARARHLQTLSDFKIVTE